MEGRSHSDALPSRREALRDSTQRSINSSSKPTYQPYRREDPKAAARVPAHTTSAHVSQVADPPEPKRPDGLRSKAIVTRVGPWQLGKMLGQGSSASVRLSRHARTHQLAAVKVVPRKLAYANQAASLANLGSIDSRMSGGVNSNRMPVAIEREVAILKLIEHPNIMKLYDIWENRANIYLVLEYVEGGDLFAYISDHGPIYEQKSIYYFRQIISAVEYCHSFGICHRDLKPENILLKKNDQIKIADFGMAALHQTPKYELTTACGSPHYAAPELLTQRPYRGEKVDIWSMGVVLYTMLAARLPFDDPNIHKLLAKTKKGIYTVPNFVTTEATDLIRHILVIDPKKRFSMAQIWQHDVVRKYDYLDDLSNEWGQPKNLRKAVKVAGVDPSEIDSQLIRQLQSLWHAFSEQELKDKLTSEDSNDQKLFYWLLYEYRERQLENYNPDMTHSASDYHHLKPATSLGKRVTTCQFTQPGSRGNVRSVSRFTVISNAAEGDVGTTRSYDPFNASNKMQPSDPQVSHARIVIHRHGSGQDDPTDALVSRLSKIRTGSVHRSARQNSQRTAQSARMQSPRSSVSSLHSSKQGTPQVRVKTRYRRGVDFSGVRKRSANHRNSGTIHSWKGPAASAKDKLPPMDVSTPATQTTRAMSTDSTPLGGPDQSLKSFSMLWNEEVRRFSSGIAKDCDEAFRSSLIMSDSLAGSIGANTGQHEGSPFTLDLGTPTTAQTPVTPTPKPWDSRPLPPPPPESESVMDEIARAKSVEQRRLKALKEDGARRQRAAKHVSHPPRAVENIATSKSADRRIVSAPVYGQNVRVLQRLPSIYESIPEHLKGGQQRIVSAPPDTPGPLPTPNEHAGLEYLSRAENTIRIVESPTAKKGINPVAAPKPLNVRKMSSVVEETVHKSHSFGGGPHDMADVSGASWQTTQTTQQSNIAKKKKSSWFRRSSKEDISTKGSKGDLSIMSSRSRDEVVMQQKSADPARTVSQSTGPPPPPLPTKRKSFGFQFWKNAKEPKMSIAGPDYEDSPSPEPKRKKQGSRPLLTMRDEPIREDSDPNVRKIDVQQNWLARLFRVKPAKRHLCFLISRRRTRQEIAILLREWKKYGIRDVEVDKERNIVFARVGPKNYLDMKEVAFAAEIMTVVEHGKRNQLSIVRLTQERGAASSFHKVVDTMQAVFVDRSLLVTDKRKARMMVKTLNA